MTKNGKNILPQEAELMGTVIRENVALITEKEHWPLCAVCPQGQWSKRGLTNLECHCTAFHTIMYDQAERAVVECEAREYSLGRKRIDPSPYELRPLVAEADPPLPPELLKSKCASCPAARWLRFADGDVECQCTQLRTIMMRKGWDPITACDAREDEAARLFDAEDAMEASA